MMSQLRHTASALLASSTFISYAVFCVTNNAQIERGWLTHRSADPSKLVVNCICAARGDSNVWFGKPGSSTERFVGRPGARSLHHVEIPAPENGTEYLYSVSTGKQQSSKATL